jgi:hypothetical protein
MGGVIPVPPTCACLVSNGAVFTFTFIYAKNRDVEYIVTPDKTVTFIQGISNCSAPCGLEYGLNKPAFEFQEGQEIFSFPKVYTSSGAQPAFY